MFVRQGFALLVSCAVLLSVQSSLGSEIIDGQEVVPHSLPYMAWLVSDRGSCGGTLISPSWVLTAAHCQGSARNTRVVLGMHRKSKNEQQSRQYRNVQKQIIKPDFNSNTLENDFMLLKLDKAVKKTKAVKPFTLRARMKEPAAGTKCLVAGWGKTENGITSDVLKSAKVVIVDRAKCARTYPWLTRNMICAGSDGTNSADTCQGDSGGPMVCNRALVGVTSFGKGCGQPGIPGVYAFLSAENLRWIKRMMKKF